MDSVTENGMMEGKNDKRLGWFIRERWRTTSWGETGWMDGWMVRKWKKVYGQSNGRRNDQADGGWMDTLIDWVYGSRGTWLDVIMDQLLIGEKWIDG